MNIYFSLNEHVILLYVIEVNSWFKCIDFKDKGDNLERFLTI